jgi:hypothetical protein
VNAKALNRDKESASKFRKSLTAPQQNDAEHFLLRITDIAVIRS